MPTSISGIAYARRALSFMSSLHTTPRLIRMRHATRVLAPQNVKRRGDQRSAGARAVRAQTAVERCAAAPPPPPQHSSVDVAGQRQRRWMCSHCDRKGAPRFAVVHCFDIAHGFQRLSERTMAAVTRVLRSGRWKPRTRSSCFSKRSLSVNLGMKYAERRQSRQLTRRLVERSDAFEMDKWNQWTTARLLGCTLREEFKNLRFHGVLSAPVTT